MEKREIEKKIIDVENYISLLQEHLSELKKQVDANCSQQANSFPKEEFALLYNKIKYDPQFNTKNIPICIWLNEKYRQETTSTFLYPSEELKDIFFIIGEFSPLPIGFANFNEDYRVEFYSCGYFHN